ncbi:K02A2.6-like [Cordylochernes scorpioides]|uniref:K02A2.6-like n=1 Tax=Cordylochernes scorpioides TaxID=51811 RepID=A0ABY6KZ78_9ARAC|nr:K02A2.6-like [Cordylochernes scorpioides]
MRTLNGRPSLQSLYGRHQSRRGHPYGQDTSVGRYCDQDAWTDLICSMDKTPPPPQLAGIGITVRAVHFALRELVNKNLKSLEEQGIIEPIKFSKGASPIVTILKNNGKIRIFYDYKTTVNLYNNPDKYPLPTIPQLLDRLRVRRLPFGLKSAVGTFQRFMDTLLIGINGVAVYLDDVLISGINCDDLKN